MPRIQEAIEAKVMASISAAGPAGVSVSELEVRLRESRRTLQRALQDLANAKRIILRGQGRGSSYFEMAPAIRQGLGFATSEDANQVWLRVRAPLGLRAPVGYNPAFIKSYQPKVRTIITRDCTSQT